MPKETWTGQELRILKEYYPKTRCSQMFELLPLHSQQAIKRKANRLGIHKQRVSNGYSLNENLFETWSSKSAYLFGYLSADGCLKNYNNGYFISITTQEADKEHLVNIKNLFSFGGEIHSHQSGYNSLCYCLTIGSKKIYQDLVKLGLTPNKTHSLQFPSTLPVELYPLYLCGLSDGDGCISYYKKPKYYLLLFRFGSASESFITSIRNIICNQLHFPHFAITKHPNIDFWAFNLSGYKAKQYLDWIYSSHLSFKLERKYQRYLLFDSKGQSLDKPLDYTSTLSQ